MREIFPIQLFSYCNNKFALLRWRHARPQSARPVHVTLFKALKSIKITDEAATAVVEDVDRHVENVVNNNIQAVHAELAALRSEVKGDIAALRGEFNGLAAGIESLKHQNVLISILISIVGLAVAAGPFVAKALR